MLKHILTTRCPRQCSYCITKNVKIKEYYSLFKVSEAYSYAIEREGSKSIMLTGGEPTIYKYFDEVLRIASLMFKEVYLTTANPEILNMPMPEISAITFSMHDEEATRQKTFSGNTIYAAVMDKLYTPTLPFRLKQQGFAGLTINEDQRGEFNFSGRIPKIEDFSIRVNRRGKCMDEAIILPNLELIYSFTKFL